MWFYCSWHWTTQQHLPSVEPSESWIPRWNEMALWDLGDGQLEFTDLERVVYGNWDGSTAWEGGTQKNPWNPVNPCSLTISALLGPFSRLRIPQLCLNQFPRVCFGFFILSGTLPSPQSPKGLQDYSVLQVLSRVLCTAQAFTRESKPIKWKACA